MSELRFKSRLIPTDPKAAALAAAAGIGLLLAGLGAAVTWQIATVAAGIIQRLPWPS
jgi:hypothetical protein